METSIEFIDLSDVEEQERLCILNFLRTWDANVEVPWKRPNQYGKSPVTNENVTSSSNHKSHHPSNNILSENNVHDMNNLNPLSQQHVYHPYTVHTIPYHTQAMYQDVMYHGPVTTSMNLINNYPPQHVQQVVSGPIETSSYKNTNNNETEYINTSDNQQTDEITLQMSNKTTDLTHAVKYSENNHVQENGEWIPTIDQQKKIENEVPAHKPAGKSWASLFSQKPMQEGHNHNECNGKTNEIINSIVKAEPECGIKLLYVENNMKNSYNDPTYYRLGEFLTGHSIDHRTISLQPRGLINRSNYCYINSILQALLACPPVYNLISGLSDIVDINSKKKSTPVIYNMSKFVKEFQHLPAAHRVSRRSDKIQKQDPNSLINCDTPFEPNYIYKMLNGLRNDTFVVEGRQEDAEEFLGCLLNGLNDEMLELMKLVEKEGPKPLNEINNFDNDLDKEWKEVTGKNKGCVTRRTELVQTPISDIFNGHLRSRVHRTGDKSSDNVQPFFTLQLNIEKASSVKEALEVLVCKNQLEGVTSSKTNEEVEAWQQVTIEDLPYVLILHLKCFDYKLDGCTKIIKAVEFPIDLKIDGKLLSSKKDYSPKAKQYKLFAIVYHDGKEASKGHYLTDAYHVGYARWLRYDDASVKAVAEEQVLKPHGTRVPYLLFYRRSDSIRSK